MKENKNFPHYWMCQKCANEMGGYMEEGHCCTVTQGVCEYCGLNHQFLVPWVDFNWPKKPQVDKIAKANRD